MANLEDAGKVAKALRCNGEGVDETANGCGSVDCPYRDAADDACDIISMCADAADLLDAHAAKIKELEAALANMWFAYENKDIDGDMLPHTFETEAVEMAAKLLGKWDSVMPRLLENATKWSQENTATLEAKLARCEMERDCKNESVGNRLLRGC